MDLLLLGRGKSCSYVLCLVACMPTLLCSVLAYKTPRACPSPSCAYVQMYKRFMGIDKPYTLINPHIRDGDA